MGAGSGLSGGQVQKAYEDPPSYRLIDDNIAKGNPVIVRIHLRDGTPHFVVVVGKQGWDYLIRDPARPAGYGVYPLSRLVGRIEALRFYKIWAAAEARTARACRTDSDGSSCAGSRARDAG